VVRVDGAVLGTDSSGAADGPVSMEMDEAEAKGKGKGGGKSKSKDKGYAKGKSKGKQKVKNDSKGKSKNGDQKGKGNDGERSKGKGKGNGRKCYVCGRTGNFARDCWQSQVRNVSSDVQQSTTAQGSPVYSVSGMSCVSQHVQQSGPQQPSSQTTHSRVARICEASAKHGELICDLRDSSPSSFHGSVHAVQETWMMLVRSCIQF